MRRQRFQTALKALLLIGMGLFLYSRIANGSLYFYISERFASLTLLAVMGLLIVGVSYRFDSEDSVTHEHDDGHEQHTHEHDNHGHSHALSWRDALLVALPIFLGIFVPPQPLGAAALANREVSVGTSSSAMPAAIRAAAEKPSIEKNILDWLYDFQIASSPTAFNDEEAQLIGFIFRDERFAEDEFSLARFVVGCCVADASYAGLVVRWPDATLLESDQWVDVRGTFQVGQFGENTMPILIAESVTPTTMPNQPYLYP